MYFRILFFAFLLTQSLNAAFQEIKIGKIDSYYDDKITYIQLREILDEIELVFETTLNTNVFDYSQNGKPIDILYVPASKLERSINSKIQRVQRKQDKLQKLQDYFSSRKDLIDQIEKEFKTQNTILNTKIKKLNAYISDINEKPLESKAQYNEVKKYVKVQKILIKDEKKKLKTIQKELSREVTRYNNKIISYNNTIKEINRLSNQIESMNRNHKKVRGMTFGLKQTVFKTSYKDGKKTTTKTVTNSMNKIEIYGFESIEQLKAVLAHEIGHLVGIPHISAKEALMNPILQKNQVHKLELTQNDIDSFMQNF